MGFLPERSVVVIRHILERYANEQPERECVFFEDGESWNYAQALQEACRAANKLLKTGVRRGENVLIFLPNGQAWLRAWWGVNSIGAIMVPVNTAYKGEMLRHICKDSEAQYIITTPEPAERLQDLDLKLNIIDPSVLAEGSTDVPIPAEPVEPWDIEMILYTSGTTGPAKGVIIPYFQIYQNNRYWLSSATCDDTFLMHYPMFHRSGLDSTSGMLSVGGRIAMLNAFPGGDRYWDVVRQTGATMALLVGSLPEFIFSRPSQPDDVDNPIRWMALGPMVRDPEAFRKRFGIEEMPIGFSMTETSLPLAYNGKITKPRSCGRVRPGVECRIVDEHDIPVPTGEVGELIIRTDLPWEMNQGYWKKPELTAHVWRNGWFHTGDLMFCDADGDYFFADRKKDAIRRRGENISSFEVEREVMAYPEVAEAACIGVPAKFGEDDVKVFVVLNEGLRFEPKALIDFLIPRMPHFMIPRYIEVVSELPKTHSMRVKKFELRSKGNTDATWDREAEGIKVKLQA